jgi:serine/threonine protein phosphatase 1
MRSNATVARIPPGQVVTAIGDVHGHLALLEPILARAERRAATEPASRHVVVLLGDVVDRGPDTRGVIERLCRGVRGCELVALRGNHEDAMLAFLTGDEERMHWLSYGGIETLLSYGIEIPDRLTAAFEGEVRRALADRFPGHHLRFLEAMPHSVTIGDYLFVHAGVRPGRSLADQSPDDLVWIREPFLSWREPFEKVVVHGHTPVREPELLPNRINLDTGAFATGRLTAAVLEEDKITLV